MERIQLFLPQQPQQLWRSTCTAVAHMLLPLLVPLQELLGVELEVRVPAHPSQLLSLPLNTLGIPPLPLSSQFSQLLRQRLAVIQGVGRSQAPLLRGLPTLQQGGCSEACLFVCRGHLSHAPAGTTGSSRGGWRPRPGVESGMTMAAAAALPLHDADASRQNRDDSPL